MKTCTPCGVEKELTEFYNSKQSKDGLSYRCKNCDTLARHKYRAENYEKFKVLSRNRIVKSKYGLSPEDFTAMLRKQNYCCAICNKHVSENKGPGAKDGSQNLCIDHCHETKRIRGLLCNSCNRGLGFLQDNYVVVQKAADYLKDYNNKPV